jgi:hypothetical protein
MKEGFLVDDFALFIRHDQPAGRGMIRYGRGLDVPALLSEHQIELRRIVAPIQ